MVEVNGRLTRAGVRPQKVGINGKEKEVINYVQFLKHIIL